jgi:hypothetical protein
VLRNVAGGMPAADSSRLLPSLKSDSPVFIPYD